MIAIAQALREGRIHRKTLAREALAGLVVGIVAIPLAMAFAIASGLKPEQGLVTGILAGVIVSLFGGSQVQIAGPTGAFIVVLLGVVQEHGVGGLLGATVLAGGLLISLGVARLGVVIRFIPHPVVVGFTAGIGIIIFTGQIAEFLGLTLAGSPREFVGQALEVARALPTVSGSTALVGGVTLAAILLLPRVTRRVPAPLVGMLLGTGVALVFHLEDVATIGSKFGGIPGAFPAFRMPEFSWESLRELIGPAFTIAMLGAIESLLSAVVADGMTGDSHDSNQELIAQGVANVVAPFFGGFASTGAIARTATNVRMGCRSPVGGVVHAAVLLATMLLLAPYARHIPLASLAAILFVVAWNMSDVHAVAALLRRGSRSDRLVLLSTMALTVFVDLVVAVEVGVALAALLFMKHMAERVEMRPLLPQDAAKDPFHAMAIAAPPEIAIFAVDGPMFFGVAHRFENAVAELDPRVRIVVLRLWKVPYLDASGANALRRTVTALRRRGRRVVVSGVQPSVRAEMERADLISLIGEHKVWESFEEAIFYARELLLEERAAAKAAADAPPPS